MAKALSSVELAVPADRLWHLIGGFGSLPDWLPYIPKSELHEGGRTRPPRQPRREYNRRTAYGIR